MVELVSQGSDELSTRTPELPYQGPLPQRRPVYGDQADAVGEQHPTLGGPVKGSYYKGPFIIGWFWASYCTVKMRCRLARWSSQGYPKPPCCCCVVTQRSPQGFSAEARGCVVSPRGVNSIYRWSRPPRDAQTCSLAPCCHLATPSPCLLVIKSGIATCAKNLTTSSSFQQHREKRRGGV